MRFGELLFQNENLVRDKDYCYGMHNGYHVIAKALNYDIFGVVQFEKLDEGRSEGLTPIIVSLQQTHKRCDIVTYEHYVQIHIRSSMGYKKDIAKLEHCMDTIINYLMSVGVRTGCANCDATESLQINHYDYVPKLLCPNCMQMVNEDIQRHASRPRIKSNIITGSVGALLGTLVGVVAWFVIYRMGYISAFAGLIMAVGAMWGYEKLGKSLDLKGIIISIVMVLVMVYITNRLCWAYEFMTVMKDEGIEMSLTDSFRNIEDIIKISEITGDYIKDLVMGYVLTIIGMGSIVISKIRER